MSENTKTLTFVGVALALAVVALVSQPSTLPMQPDDMRGKELFENFTDPLQATSMEVFKFDEATSTIAPFKVARVNDRWAIPSHDNYPADAKDHLAEAATSVMGLKVLAVVSANAGDHALYGVVDPSPDAGSSKLEMGATGVGSRVIMRDKEDKVLLDLIVGKADKEHPDVRYVRRAKEDPVYAVKLNTDKLSAKFGDWIEKDLLKMNAFDLMGLKIEDYSIDLAAQNPMQERGRFSLEYSDAAEKKWKMVEDRVVEGSQMVDGKLADDEELNTAKLDGLKTALGELKIIDVSRKPEGLIANLKANGDILKDKAAARALQERGYYLARSPRGGMELLSNEGETRVAMKDGVEYVLRFGQIAAGSAQEEKKEGEKGKPEEASGGANRYLFVMAEFNPTPSRSPNCNRSRGPGRGGQGRREGRRKERGREARGRRRQEARSQGGTRADREGKQTQAGRLRAEAQEGRRARQGAQRALCRLVLRHLRQRLPEDPPAAC